MGGGYSSPVLPLSVNNGVTCERCGDQCTGVVCGFCRRICCDACVCDARFGWLLRDGKRSCLTCFDDIMNTKDGTPGLSMSQHRSDKGKTVPIAVLPVREPGQAPWFTLLAGISPIFCGHKDTYVGQHVFLVIDAPDVESVDDRLGKAILAAAPTNAFSLQADVRFLAGTTPESPRDLAAGVAAVTHPLGQVRWDLKTGRAARDSVYVPPGTTAVLIRTRMFATDDSDSVLADDTVPSGARGVSVGYYVLRAQGHTLTHKAVPQ